MCLEDGKATAVLFSDVQMYPEDEMVNEGIIRCRGRLKDRTQQ